jgi:hypothetical protein
MPVVINEPLSPIDFGSSVCDMFPNYLSQTREEFVSEYLVCAALIRPNAGTLSAAASAMSRKAASAVAAAPAAQTVSAAAAQMAAQAAASGMVSLDIPKSLIYRRSYVLEYAISRHLSRTEYLHLQSAFRQPHSTCRRSRVSLRTRSPRS